MTSESNRLVVLVLDSTAEAYDPWTRRERESDWRGNSIIERFVSSMNECAWP
jgi:hypothetical protein